MATDTAGAPSRPEPGAAGAGHRAPAPALLSVRDLTVEFATPDGPQRAVDHLSFDVRPGEVLGLVGESGCGKTVTALAVFGLLPDGARVAGGEIVFAGCDLLAAGRHHVAGLRGREMGMVFQDPVSSLNPVRRIGDQIAQVLRAHRRDLSRRAARDRAVELLALVGVPEARARARDYPHQWSGGMCQRAMIAMAVANGPRLLVADEPTTALDVTTQAEVLRVLASAGRHAGATTVLITHDLGVVAEMADRAVVMYSGRAVEAAAVEDLFSRPCHPYTVGLLGSRPVLAGGDARLVPIPGHPPSGTAPPPGCPFHPRCARGRDRAVCRSEPPAMRAVGGPGHLAACHFAGEPATGAGPGPGPGAGAP